MGLGRRLLLAVALTPFVVHDSFILHALLITCLWAGLASAWNILAGFAGQLSFGHAAFLGVGAYTMGILDTSLGVTPWLGMIAGGGVAALLSVVIGVPAFRLRGPYFALATLALAEVVRIVAVYWDGLTGGSSGLLMPIETGFVAMSWTGQGAVPMADGRLSRHRLADRRVAASARASAISLRRSVRIRKRPPSRASIRHG